MRVSQGLGARPKTPLPVNRCESSPSGSPVFGAGRDAQTVENACRRPGWDPCPADEARGSVVG